MVIPGIDAGSDQATVFWKEPTVIDNCKIAQVTSSHQPGSEFPVGLTVVTYDAIDEVGNSQKCTFSIQVDTIEAEVLLDLITIYRAFSPNGDGFNDLWVIENIEQYADNSVVIFDRWGSIIYEASGYNNQDIVWNGFGNKPRMSSREIVPAGTYYFNITLPGVGSEKGFVELLE
jgi:gliding motility-associated-like protein